MVAVVKYYDRDLLKQPRPEFVLRVHACHVMDSNQYADFKRVS